ncbi:hypothetical protein ScPMuIL_013773 [Solemya velum]
MADDQCPTRQYMDEADVHWRHGRKPDYSVVNKKYLAEKSRNWKADSLEKLVENLVKTWEMESSHKMDAKDWHTVDKETFRINVNGKFDYTLADNISKGNYQLLLADSPLYDTDKESNSSSHKLFKTVFPTGFAWELLELFSGPPNVSFSWRHWGKWDGKYYDVEPTGETIELLGFCVSRVTEDLKVKKLEIYYDPNPMLTQLMKLDKKVCPMQSCAE